MGLLPHLPLMMNFSKTEIVCFGHYYLGKNPYSPPTPSQCNANDVKVKGHVVPVLIYINVGHICDEKEQLMVDCRL